MRHVEVLLPLLVLVLVLVLPEIDFFCRGKFLAALGNRSH